MSFDMVKFANDLLRTAAKHQAAAHPKYPGKFCEDCAEDGEQTPATQEWDARYMYSGGLFLCEKCADRRQEASCDE